MKLIAFTAAALVALTGTAAAAAPAQDRVVVRERTVAPGTRNTRVVVTERTTTTTRRGYDRPRYRWRTSCRTRWVDGERRRVCRRIRYRY